MIDASERAEFARGWKPLAAAAAGVGFGITGLAFYCFGVFVVPLTEAFGWTRGEVTRGSSAMIIATAITAPLIGLIIDRYGARRVALISMLLVAAGYFVLSNTGPVLQMFYLTWFVMALGAAGTTPVVFTRTVNMWFDKARGLALGIALAGSGLSGIVGPMICTWLIRNYGWSGAYVGFALITLIVAFPILLWGFKEREFPQNASGAQLAGMTVPQAIRTRDFWQIAIGFILVSSVIASLVINLVPLLRDRGMSPEEAAALAGLLGFSILIGRIAIGYLVDRFGGSMVARILLSVTAIGCVLLSLPNAPAFVPVVSVIVIGLATAAEVDLVAYLSSRHFGMRAYGKIYGLQITAFYIGSAGGPLLAGIAYDRFHGYVEVLYTCAAALAVGALIVGTLGKPPNFAEIPAIPAE